MSPPTSKVWKFFKRCNDSKTVQCQLCEVELTYTRRDYKYAKPHQRMLDFLLDDNSEDNAESEITAFMRERLIQTLILLRGGKIIPINIQDSRSCAPVFSCSVGKNLLGSWFDCYEASQQTVIVQIIFLNKNSVPQ